jgi:two-component system, OmpR family, response regulator
VEACFFCKKHHNQHLLIPYFALCWQERRDETMQILVIEDDKTVADYICKGLRDARHSVTHAADGREGLSKAMESDYDLLIVDRMLPFVDGLEVIARLRQAEKNMPILILSALSEVDDRVKGLQAGGDDYLVKPFAFTELLARVEALARRHHSEASTISKLHLGDLQMDLLARTVTRAGKKVNLQAREFSLLEYLMRHKGQVVTRTMLLENVWNYHFDPQTNVIDVHISRLRRKIDDGHTKQMIKTIRGAGYTITDA